MSKICVFCKKTFSTKNILLTHQKTAKYCIKLRELNINIEEKEHDEDFCSCEFFIQTLSIINARIYKQLNNNKSE